MKVKARGERENYSFILCDSYREKKKKEKLNQVSCQLNFRFKS